MPRAHKHLKDDIESKIESGEYVLGDLVEPKTYTRLVLVDGVITKKSFTVGARRIPLEEIRIRIYKEHRELGMISQS